MAEVSFQKNAAPTQDAEVIREIVNVPTPVEGVTVPSVNTAAIPIGLAAGTVPETIPATAIPNLPVDSAPAATIPTTSAVIVAPPAAVAPSQYDPTQLDEENIGFEDVILPRINIVQKVGDLSNIFNGGEVVLNQETVIHEPPFIHPSDPSKNTPGSGLLNILVLGFRRKQFTEKIEGGKLGMLLNNEADVAKNNGTLDYKEHKQSVEASKLPGGQPPKRLFQRLATALCLVERPANVPDEDHVLFPHEFEGKFYTLVLWSMKGTAYTAAAKVLFTAKKLGHLKTGYTAQGWTLTTKLEEFFGNFAYVPVIRPGQKSSPGLRDFCKRIIGAGN